MTARVRLREAAAIAVELGALATAVSLPQGFRAGAQAALQWVREGGPGPLTGAMTAPQPPMRAIVAELAAAESVIYGHPSPLRDFAVGVEHALLWAELATPTPPSGRSMPSCGAGGAASNMRIPTIPRSAAGRGRNGVPTAPPAR